MKQVKLDVPFDIKWVILETFFPSGVRRGRGDSFLLIIMQASRVCWISEYLLKISATSRQLWSAMNSFSARALPRTHWGRLQRSPDSLVDLTGPSSKGDREG